MTRADVVAEALAWEGTPYHHRARLKGIGVDCAQYPIAVYSALRLMPAISPAYASDWMMHRDEERFVSIVRQHAREIERDKASPGDFAIFKFGRCFSHGAILIEPPIAIHAVIRGGCVCRADIDRDADLAERPVKFFTLF